MGRILPELGMEQITAFTATASPLILNKIKSILFSDLSFNLVMANPDRVNIHYEVRPVLSRMAGPDGADPTDRTAGHHFLHHKKAD